MKIGDPLLHAEKGRRTDPSVRMLAARLEQPLAEAAVGEPTKELTGEANRRQNQAHTPPSIRPPREAHSFIMPKNDALGNLCY